ncbi:glycosyltransferase family 4 protein [Corticibacterium sp. UT-5YL-CI-8]|nr:glycosyltransferase family 4 protein [Tianweitania sp. UT-5YL-CI-8]
MRVSYLYSEDYARLTGGWVYNSRLAAELAKQVSGFSELSVPIAFPRIEDDDRARLAKAFADFPDDAVLLSDHLHIADLEPMLRKRRFRVVSIFHHSQAIEDEANGISVDRDPERRGLELCDVVIVTSEATKDYLMRHYRVPSERVLVAIPGNDAATRSAAYSITTPRTILSVGAVIPRKRYDYLIEAARQLKQRDWQWLIVGDLERHPDYVEALRKQIGDAGLGEAIRLIGAVLDSDLARIWSTASLFVAASHYEGYGMAVAEALCHGVPVVTTSSGAVVTWAHEGVVFAPVEDALAFAADIDALLAEPAGLTELADAAWIFGSALPDWQQTFRDMAGRMEHALMPRSLSQSA